MSAAQRMAAPLARTDRRKAESRQRLLDAARRLFIERGYDATRPQDIARAADVGYGTFYLHFADKRECFLAFAEAARSELHSAVNERLAGVDGVEPQLRVLLEAMLDYAERNPGVLKAAMTDVSMIASGGEGDTSLVERWAEQWAAQIRAGARVGAIHADYDAEVAGHAIVGLIRGAAACGRDRRAALVDTVARFLTRALVPEGAAETAKHHRFIAGEADP
ncbi:MAG TPA: helix-turn-helix domain-containing protein [Stellaceae bacterium]|jgi:AcrR family transcriptional regulator|nr:helix-turn-helix domain-containing protein [Stellaceae bacterium]